MNFETTVAIDAPAERVWSALADVERWPEWTASMTRLEPLTPAPFGVSSRVRVKQPRMRALEWEVTGFVPGQEFTWRSTIMGITTVAAHRIAPAPGGGVTVTLTLTESGRLAPLVGRLTARITRRYVNMEANGLKQRCERAPAGADDGSRRRDASAG